MWSEHNASNVQITGRNRGPLTTQPPKTRNEPTINKQREEQLNDACESGLVVTIWARRMFLMTGNSEYIENNLRTSRANVHAMFKIAMLVACMPQGSVHSAVCM